jgi:sulfur-oxidizing protein SoxA
MTAPALRDEGGGMRHEGRLVASPFLAKPALALLAACALTAQGAEPQRPQPPKSGIEFASADVRALQADDFANPGMLWVARGAKLWSAPAGSAGKSCMDCHGNAGASMKGVAARYPRVDPGAGPVNLEGRVNLCRVRQQQAEPLKPESDELLGLTAFVAHQSRGAPVAVALDGAGRESFERGRAQYTKRIGQMNLACTHCHDRNWGKQLFAETISQGHGNGYPAYRLEWQSVGSLQRRIRACYFGVRAEMPPFGARELLDLELYLAWRAGGLPVETPGVRR